MSIEELQKLNAELLMALQAVWGAVENDSLEVMDLSIVRRAIEDAAKAPSAVHPSTTPIIDVWIDPRTMQRSLLDHGTPLAPFDKREFVGSLVWSTDPQDAPINLENLKLRPNRPTDANAGGLRRLRARVEEMQDAACTFGEHSKEAVRTALDGVLDEIDGLTADKPTNAADAVVRSAVYDCNCGLIFREQGRCRKCGTVFGQIGQS